jgi:hypothetical protein
MMVIRDSLRHVVAATPQLDDSVASPTGLPAQALCQFSRLSNGRIVWAVGARMVCV